MELPRPATRSTLQPYELAIGIEDGDAGRVDIKDVDPAVAVRVDHSGCEKMQGLRPLFLAAQREEAPCIPVERQVPSRVDDDLDPGRIATHHVGLARRVTRAAGGGGEGGGAHEDHGPGRSEEHTTELQSRGPILSP